MTLAELVLPAGSPADRLGRRRQFAVGLASISVALLVPALAVADLTAWCTSWT